MSTRSRLGAWGLGIVLAGCTPASPPPASAAVSAPAPAPALPPTSLERTIDSTVALVLEASPVACAWGSSGVVAAEGPVPYWVIGMVDVAPPVALTEVRLGRLRLLDEDGRVLGEADREWELRGATTDRSAADFSRHGTSALSEPLAEDRAHRLWFRARMEDAFTGTGRAPARYSLVLRTAQGDATIEGPVGSQWPTG